MPVAFPRSNGLVIFLYWYGEFDASDVILYGDMVICCYYGDNKSNSGLMENAYGILPRRIYFKAGWE